MSVGERFPSDAMTPMYSKEPKVSRYRACQAILRHMVGYGLYRTSMEDKGNRSTLAYPGMDVRVVMDLRGTIRRKGRGFIESLRETGSSRPLVVMDWPKGAEHPDDVVVNIPLNDWVKIVRANMEEK